ncbi:MAG: hypothetical protein IPK19_15875 [Chloroflexi bacterium]|nr:hypothetical protein [Chloroflexota bacterium]
MFRRFLIGSMVALIVICGVSFALLAHWWNNSSDVAHVHEVAQRIADFELPPGYRPDYAVDVLGFSIAAYRSADGKGHLAFVMGPVGIVPDEGVVQGYVVNTSRHEDWRENRVLRTEDRMVRGASATISFSERINGEGVPYRNLNLVFTGKSGNALLVVNEPVSAWNDAAIEALIASLG